MTYDQTIRDAAGRAADWLEANPMNHISGDLATNERGRGVPFHDDTAVCFCALGRFGRELPQNDLVADYPLLFEVLGESEAQRVYRANDKGIGQPTLIDKSGRGSPEGIKMLRKIQNGEEL